MAERNGNGQQGMDLIVMLHSEVRGILEALDRQEQRADRFDVQLGQHEEALRRFEEESRRFQQETRSLFADQKQLYGEMKSHVRRVAELILGVGDRLNDHERRLSAIESKGR